MRNKLFALLLLLGLFFPTLTAHGAEAQHPYTVAEVENLCGGIVAYKEAACGASSVQEYINTGLSAAAGTTAEFYAIALSQSGSYDFSAYEKALLNFLKSTEIYSATSREKYALALIACGSGNAYIRRVCNSDIGGQGLMSLVFGLHLLNNGYPSSSYTVDSLIGAILSSRLSDGGWAVIGSSGDVDVTAMTVQALAPYYGRYSGVTAAIDGALSLLSQRQLSDGGFLSMGVENCESAAQVLTALSALGIDQNTDPRFIKNGCTVLDAMLAFRNADGSFAHTGGGFNESATVQAFYAMRAYLRMRYGQSPLYILDRRNPSALSPVEPDPTEEPTASDQSATAAPGDPPSVAPTDEDGSETTDPAAPTRTDTDTADSATFQPSATENSLSSPDEAEHHSGGYKLWAILAVSGAGAIACVILLMRKKRGFKHYLAVILIAAGAIVFILLTNFESPAAYSKIGEKGNPTGTVTMSVRCNVLKGEETLPDYIPDDCVILPETTFTLSEGETVYDILIEASKRYGIHIDNRGGANSAYIAGIGYLYEFAYGELSGWMYRVNGVFPEVGCQGYSLSDGDRIEWLYTKNIGKDL